MLILGLFHRSRISGLPAVPSASKLDNSKGSKTAVGSLVSGCLVSVEDTDVSFKGIPVCAEICAGIPLSSILADMVVIWRNAQKKCRAVLVGGLRCYFSQCISQSPSICCMMGRKIERGAQWRYSRKAHKWDSAVVAEAWLTWGSWLVIYVASVIHFESLRTSA